VASTVEPNGAIAIIVACCAPYVMESGDRSRPHPASRLSAIIMSRHEVPEWRGELAAWLAILGCIHAANLQGRSFAYIAV